MLEVLRSWTMRGHPNLDDLGPALPREQWTLVDAVRHQAVAAGDANFIFRGWSPVSPFRSSMI